MIVIHKVYLSRELTRRQREKTDNTWKKNDQWSEIQSCKAELCLTSVIMGEKENTKGEFEK